MKKLQDKIIAITGASSGIGKSCALLAAKLGATPILLARSEDSLRAIVEEIKHKTSNIGFHSLDVTNMEQIDDVVANIHAQYGRIDMWINNAGYGIFSSFTDTTLEDIQGMMNVNYLGTVRCTRAVLPYMLKQKSGHIVNVASVAGKLATPKSSGYSASKFAVIGFTQSLRQELKGSGVSVSSVNPGPVCTPFFDHADPAGDYRRSVEKFMVTPESVAQAILHTIHTRQGDITIPRYMQIGVVLSHLFPRFFERLIAPLLNKK
ncbi:SDR family oxidoreductase [Aneurinibacillus aneurinilyticus]|uniref:Oxidoreductase, short chain dehydrogenase/reductase family protein n=1 Tax=Aneurinibacillus aneurinilyticus ATCC 12856 TaxID=649747 RepID=U1X592_ANEAE|nr:SDR family oxidoreductase [Aneurinibacillus aneurinilyticus]ERI10140.1 oxidoreductase, short chain dehydrogenase/reductase family protein [Aneurinibacillus aneurinilyticus ATCC 12856]MED0705217.1 SDR family oxidoreductase [Aneurinibacillus aneurinilyticus]MED0723022.1 SDR family oxidoreductase [Aneurinibacillus aneurinilyticus]MED0733543.1 SDR family oxidoreductase [Aneurinibacillus aneurinilyticus]MED0740044.1 SDR family oxidoreductase [Aneurinibacillus aneurinilyticus]